MHTLSSAPEIAESARPLSLDARLRLTRCVADAPNADSAAPHKCLLPEQSLRFGSICTRIARKRSEREDNEENEESEEESGVERSFGDGDARKCNFEREFNWKCRWSRDRTAVYVSVCLATIAADCVCVVCRSRVLEATNTVRRWRRDSPNYACRSSQDVNDVNSRTRRLVGWPVTV